uniref:Uncharacterized protein n=1 Tax=Canis lupus dingo TaxID=286419 RepID=A0A8C0L878_CANLU
YTLELQKEGRCMMIWFLNLPREAVVVPLSEPPQPEQDYSGHTEPVKKQETKCVAFALRPSKRTFPHQKLTSGSFSWMDFFF